MLVSCRGGSGKVSAEYLALYLIQVDYALRPSGRLAVWQKNGTLMLDPIATVHRRAARLLWSYKVTLVFHLLPALRWLLAIAYKLTF